MIGGLGGKKLVTDERVMELEDVWLAVSWIGWRWKALVVVGFGQGEVEMGGGAVGLEGVVSVEVNSEQGLEGVVELETHGGGLERRPLVVGS